MDLLELNRLKLHHHPETNTSWYSNLLTPDEPVAAKLADLAPLYATVSTGSFPNLLGDALEIIVFQCLQPINAQNPVRLNNSWVTMTGFIWLSESRNGYLSKETD
jgi:hypothetical protein